MSWPSAVACVAAPMCLCRPPRCINVARTSGICGSWGVSVSSKHLSRNGTHRRFQPFVLERRLFCLRASCVTHTSRSMAGIFEKIVAGEIPSHKIYEDDLVLKAIARTWGHHFLFQHVYTNRMVRPRKCVNKREREIQGVVVPERYRKAVARSCRPIWIDSQFCFLVRF